MTKRNDVVGEKRLMNNGYEAEIIEYTNKNNIKVIFKELNNDIVESTYCQFKKSGIKSRLSPSVQGIGIIGNISIKDTNNNILSSYWSWYNMLQRCYSEKFKENNPTYKDCIVCKEWLFYPNFKKWYDDNFYEIQGQKMCLDKDILHKGNKIYSPDTCVFVPKSINSLFTKRDSTRGDLPIGIINNKFSNKKYAMCCNLFNPDTGKSSHHTLKYGDSTIELFNAYKEVKEKNIKLVADSYKNKIPKKLYEAMYNWVVEIDD